MVREFLTNNRTKILKIVLPVVVVIGILLLVFVIGGKLTGKKPTGQQSPPEPEKITNEGLVTILPQGEKGLGGQAYLYEINGTTSRVEIYLDPRSAKNPAATSSANFFAGIYAGKCESKGQILMPVAKLTSWATQTNLNINFGSFQQADTIVDIRQDKASTQSSIACGKIYYQH